MDDDAGKSRIDQSIVQGRGNKYLVFYDEEQNI
jgi:hypothetical protein